MQFDQNMSFFCSNIIDCLICMFFFFLFFGNMFGNDSLLILRIYWSSWRNVVHASCWGLITQCPLIHDIITASLFRRAGDHAPPLDRGIQRVGVDRRCWGRRGVRGLNLSGQLVDPAGQLVEKRARARFSSSSPRFLGLDARRRLESVVAPLSEDRRLR